jgi:uncharacterized protein with gpF-like domain
MGGQHHTGPWSNGDKKLVNLCPGQSKEEEEEEEEEEKEEKNKKKKKKKKEKKKKMKKKTNNNNLGLGFWELYIGNPEITI